jgi:endonuclease/exonuclease/phosphatase family metal-dependent hydrolase
VNRIPFHEAQDAWNDDARRFAWKNDEIRATRSGQVRIATWNVHQWKHPDGNWISNEKVNRAISSINADILCLQEFTDENLPSAIPDMYPHKFVEYTVAGYNGFANAIFSKHPILDQHVIELPNGGIERRICLRASILGFNIYNAHLEVRGGSDGDIHKYRRPQMRAILEDIANRNRVVLCGDFNVGTVAPEDAEFHSNIQMTSNKPPRMISSSIYGGLVDHIYTSFDLRLASEAAAAYYSSLSDHYCLVLDIDKN